MNPIVGVRPNQINLNDPNVSDYTKFEAAKTELIYCLTQIDLKNRDREYLLEKENRAIELQNYLNEQQKQNKACYVATMAYGTYEHPNVIILRNFRDTVLSKSKIGLWFISKYYKYSPKLVELLKEKKGMNFLIRKFLDQVIKIIR